MKRFSIPGVRFVSSAERRSYDNTLDVFNAQIWAREALLQLVPDLVLANTVYRDYSDQVAKFGDVVNVARPGTFVGKRKGALCEEVQIQDGSADSFQVPLDQYLYVTFKICDGEENRPMLDLIQLFSTPAVVALREMIDGVVGGQHVHFWNTSGGHLNGVTDVNVDDYILETRTAMTLNRVPQRPRTMILGPLMERSFLKKDLFRQYNTSGSTNTLRTGEIGEIYGFDFFIAHTAPHVTAGQPTITALVNNAGGYPVGATAITVDTASAPMAAGLFVAIAGDDTPQRVVASTVAAAAGILTISPGLKRAVADNAAVVAVAPGAVNNATGYAATTATPHRRVGYAKFIRTDGWGANIPQVSQPVAFGADLPIYSILQVRNVDDSNVALPAGSFDIMLDRPLEANLIDNELVALGPVGSYNFAFSADALAAAFRPLPKPRVGALSAVVQDSGIPLRTTITYDGKAQAHFITYDLLMGIGVWDIHRGAVMFA